MTQKKDFKQKSETEESPIQSCHQGEQNEQKSSENYEEVKEIKEMSPQSNIVIKNNSISPSKIDLKEIISEASQKELISPTKKDMGIREYIRNFNNKTIMSVSNITNGHTCKFTKIS